MSRRRLSKHQQRRIAQQHHRIGERGGDPGVSGLGELCEGLVVARYSRQAEVTAVGPGDAEIAVRCHIRANIGDLVTGDRVMWRPGAPSGVIESVLPRTSLMSRPNARGELRPVAANVDQIAVVIAPEPPPHQNLVDRYLVAIEQLGIEALIVVNKADLITGQGGDMAELIELYRSLDYRVLSVSALDAAGLGQLEAALRENTTVFVGQSGVGKSSLINGLHPEARAATGALSDVSKGRHTTTAARYYSLPGGGHLIDSPGIREFGLWHLDAAEVATGFIEFRPHLGQCRFRNCRHMDEPNCAIAEAVARGDISAGRWWSYQQIVNNLSP